MVRYGTRFGCRWGQPHDFTVIHENKTAKWERCMICRTTRRWNKGYKGRTDNKRYLIDHVRNFAQPSGSTKRVFMKIYHPEKCLIKI